MYAKEETKAIGPSKKSYTYDINYISISMNTGHITLKPDKSRLKYLTMNSYIKLIRHTRIRILKRYQDVRVAYKILFSNNVRINKK